MAQVTKVPVSRLVKDGSDDGPAKKSRYDLIHSLVSSPKPITYHTGGNANAVCKYSGLNYWHYFDIACNKEGRGWGWQIRIFLRNFGENCLFLGNILLILRGFFWGKKEVVI